MKDRIPTLPGRVYIVPQGGTGYFATITRTDEPTEIGTPICKSTILTDAVAAMYGGDENMYPNEVFQVIHKRLSGRVRIVHGTYVGTGETISNGTIRYVNELTFPFWPLIVHIYELGASLHSGTLGTTEGTKYVILPSDAQSFVFVGNKDGYMTSMINTVAFNGSKLSWALAVSGAPAAAQFNESGKTYGYYAIGGGSY